MTLLSTVQSTVLSIPSPSDGVWNLGPVPLRGYALCIVLGVLIAIWLGERRWVARGGRVGEVQDLALWAVPLGLVGARLYHVATDYGCYFVESKCADEKTYQGPWGVLYIWHGGLSVWGAVAGGALGVLLFCRLRGIRILPMLDALAPTVALAQAIGRWGNWFNQELFGKPTDLPWGLEIEPRKRPEGYEDYATFHPTFLYECLWNLGVMGLVLWADRRFKLGFGRAFALYVMGYTAGRTWIEAMRIDTVQLGDVFGLRFNVWTSVVLFALAAAYLVWSLRRRPGREEQVYADRAAARDGEKADSADEQEPESGESDEADEPDESDETDDEVTRDSPA